MSRRNVLLVVAAVIVATVCARLGYWQVERLRERRAHNATVADRLSAAPADFHALPSDSSARYRRVVVSGTPDYANDVVLGPRTRSGAPGVNVMTPIRIEGSDTAVLVNRGWAYSPDAMTAELEALREADGVREFVGYAELVGSATGTTEVTGRSRTFRRLDRDALERVLPYPVHDVYVVATGDSAVSVSGYPLMRLGDPPLDEGPHLSYAFQWFAFGAVALVGTAVAIAAGRRSRQLGAVPRAPGAARTMHNGSQGNR